MKKRRYAIGPGAASLILMIVVLCMSIFALLALSEANNGAKISKRAMQIAETEYALSSRAEKKLMELDTVLKTARAVSADDVSYYSAVREKLPEGFEMKEKYVSCVLSEDGVKELYVEAEILPAGNSAAYEVTAFVFYTP